MKIGDLKTYMPFKGLNDDYLKEALNHIKVEKHAKGTMLFKRNKTVKAKFYLIQGQIDLIDNQFNKLEVVSGSERAKSPLNTSSPTTTSGLAKADTVTFTVDAEYLDRLIAWSQTSKTKNTSLAAASSAKPDDLSLSGVFGAVSDMIVEETHEDDWMSALLQSPLFTSIPATQVQELFTRFEDITAGVGEKIVVEGQPGDYFYVLASGAAKVSDRSESVNAKLYPGAYFGEEALLGNTVRNASVEMVEAGIVKRLDREDFAALLKAPVLKYIEDNHLDKLKKPYKLLDVKMPIEYRMSHLPGSINIPLSRLRGAMHELGKTNLYLVPEDAGSRADIAAHLLCQAGFEAMILKQAAVEV